jgi:TM2 domain-containing membrane protein YozV
MSASMDGMSVAELQLIEQRLTNEGPNLAVAYILFFFLWFLSAHRFYLGKPGTAILQILSYFVLIGFVWALVDIFLMPGMVRERQEELRKTYARRLVNA